MSLLIFLFVIAVVDSKAIDNSTACNGFQANFSVKDIVGTWNVVAIIPEKMFPEKHVTCYKVEICETDEAGLRWLINNTVKSSKTNLTHDTDSIIVRQRYHTETPFDVWSKSVHGVNGCFQQVISLDIRKNHIHKTLKNDAMMQLHLLEVKGEQPFLLQMLWGRMIAVVIYRRNQLINVPLLDTGLLHNGRVSGLLNHADQGVVQDELKPAFELINKLRGPQRLPKICNNHLKNLLV